MRWSSADAEERRIAGQQRIDEIGAGDARRLDVERAEPAADREQPEVLVEEDLQHETEPEDRQRDSGDGEEPRGVVEQPAAAGGGEDAERDTDDDGDEEGSERSARWWRAGTARDRRRRDARVVTESPRSPWNSPVM